MQEVNFLKSLHTSTKRDYAARMNAEKPACMRKAKEWGFDYWDGDRKYGYGGMKYDGRYVLIADTMIKNYDLKRDENVLDIGCGKGFLLYEFSQYGLQVDGIDISEYAIKNAKINTLEIGNCVSLPYDDGNFDFVYSVMTFHNLGYTELKKSIKELIRVGKEKYYIAIESYTTEEELQNLQSWALTAKSFYDHDDWREILNDNGYKGDVEFLDFK